MELKNIAFKFIPNISTTHTETTHKSFGEFRNSTGDNIDLRLFYFPGGYSLTFEEI